MQFNNNHLSIIYQHILSRLDFRFSPCFSKKAFILAVLLTTPWFSLIAQNQIDHWETIVYDSSLWKFFPGTSDPGTAWNMSAYNDTTWPIGKGGIGYGDSDDRTSIAPVVSVFLRKKFTITDLDAIEQALLHVDYDDGFVAYINGVEVARAFMGTATAIPYNSTSSGLHEALLYQGVSPEGFLIKKEKLTTLLVQGENILALQVHNENLGSSDLSAAAFLSIGLINSTTAYGPLPSWFVEPLVFKSSNLPIIIINTNNQTIMDETRIIADMGIIYNGPGSLNTITDQPNNYNGKVSMEYRGESSQSFPKRSLTLETQDIQGNNLNVSLLDLPPENDWVLYAPYTDKTLIRDVITYKLGNDMGNYAPRTRFVELILNDEYYGVYVLIERIKRDKNRINIATLKPDDIAGDELTGGYLLRVDKIDGNDFPSWTTSTVPRIPGENIINFQYYDPEGSELSDPQRTYIRNFIGQVESSLASPTFAHADNGFKKYVDVAPAIDFMLVNEIGKNIDSYVYSTYLFKDKDSKGGKLQMGPLWDFNLAYGNVDYSQNAQFAPGWMWSEQYRMFWFRRMIEDPVFTRSLKCRWEQLRTTFLTNDYFTRAIDSMAIVLNEAQVRNYQRWPILGTYIWPNQYIGLTYGDEINFMKQWIITRLQWMDANMPGNCDLITDIQDEEIDNIITVYPNPSTNTFTISLHQQPEKEVRIEIHSILGQEVLNTVTLAQTFSWDGKGKNNEVVPAGLYVISIFSGDTLLDRQKVIKQ
jgi:CotH kinase protein/Secretion system C-terminal sorting domain